jgi:hypothetical protein
MSFDFASPASAGDVSYSLGKQAAKGTVAAAVYEVLHLGGDEGPGLLTDQGQLEVGGGYYTGNRVRRVGARPSFNAAGRCYLRAFALMLQGAGIVKTAETGTPAVATMTPATTSAAVPYYTFGANYGPGGPNIQQIDARIAVAELNVIPGQPLQARMAGLGRRHMVSALVPTADPNPLEPSAVAPIAAADAVIFGEDDVCFRAVDLMVTQALFADNQCIGSSYPQDITATGLIVTLSGVLACNDEIYRALAYGGASATEAGATFQEGQFRLKLSTDADMGPTAPLDVPGFLSMEFGNARYWMPANVATVPGRDVVTPFTAICTTTVTVQISDGSAFPYLD